MPKALISTYLSFFPVTVGMVKGLRSPDPIQLDLMRTYNASRAQIFWKLRCAGLGAVPVRLDEGGGRDRAWSAPSSASCRPARWPASARGCSPAPITARPSRSGRRWSPAAFLAGAARRARRPRRAHRRSRAWGRDRHERPARSQILWPRGIASPSLASVAGALAAWPVGHGLVAGDRRLPLAGARRRWSSICAAGLAAGADRCRGARRRSARRRAVRRRRQPALRLLAAGRVGLAARLALRRRRSPTLRPRADRRSRALGVAVPLLFGVWILILWEVVVRGFGVPP